MTWLDFMEKNKAVGQILRMRQPSPQYHEKRPSIRPKA
jgi:hypothetical protein